MTKRLVNKGVTVVRDGKRVRPEIGKNFDFTAEEITRITDVEPTALSKADAGEDGEAAVASTTAKTTTTTDKPAASGQTKTAKAAGKAAGKSAGKAAAKTPEGDSDAELGGGEGGGEAADDDL
jgi:hypothetical protein